MHRKFAFTQCQRKANNKKTKMPCNINVFLCHCGEEFAQSLGLSNDASGIRGKRIRNSLFFRLKFLSRQIVLCLGLKQLKCIAKCASEEISILLKCSKVSHTKWEQ